jgi:CP family cyanate transporter-like MFS transporter
MGLQSALAYCVFGWLAVILQDRGINAVASGLVVSCINHGATDLGTRSSPWLATRHRDQRPMIAIVLGLTLDRPARLPLRA